MKLHVVFDSDTPFVGKRFTDDVRKRNPCFAQLTITVGGSCETFALVSPCPSNKHTGVNIYLDEVSMIKNLPLNPRYLEKSRGKQNWIGCWGVT